MDADAVRILIIEDDPDQALLIGNFVKMLGFEFEVAENGQAGLDFLKTKPASLVLLDMGLPDMPGMAVLNQIMNTPELSETPVIVITADQSDEILMAALSSGADDFLRKPVRMAEFAPRIQKSLELQTYKTKLEEANQKLETEKKGLTRFFSDDIADQILSGEIIPELGGTLREASIMFLDLRASTRLAETLPPTEFVELLNLFFTDIMDIIFTLKGSVNKMLGDGILATFGCPLANGDDTFQAVHAAIKIREQVQLFNQFRPDYIKEDLEIGIGISTGQVFAGNIGSQRLIEYTVLGDPVNLAARLQNLNKKLGTDILIDDPTFRKIKDRVEVGRRIRGLVRGKSQIVDIYTVESMVKQVVARQNHADW